MIVDLALFIQNALIRIGGQDLYDEVVEAFYFYVAIHLTLDGKLRFIDQGSPVLTDGVGKRVGLILPI